MYLVFEENSSEVGVFDRSTNTQFSEVKIREDTRRGCYLLGFTAKSREDVNQCQVVFILFV